jgi:hypothetical protein
MTNEVNKQLTITEQIFKDIVWDTALKAATVNYPVLAVWPISAFVNTISNYIFSGVKQVVDVGAIELLNSAHQSAYQKSSITLAVIAHDKGINSLEFINARKAALDAMAVFTQVNQ